LVLVVVAERFFRAIRRRPQPCREIRIGLKAQWRRGAPHRLEAVDQLRNLVGHRLGPLQQLGRFIDAAKEHPKFGVGRNHVAIMSTHLCRHDWRVARLFVL
jgi:hypothetical protein